jgi:hypothetical protein
VGIVGVFDIRLPFGIGDAGDIVGKLRIRGTVARVRERDGLVSREREIETENDILEIPGLPVRIGIRIVIEVYLPPVEIGNLADSVA